MSLVRLPFVLPAVLGFHIAVTSPNVPSSGEAVPTLTIREKFLFPVVRWGCGFLKVVYWAGTMAEVAAVLSSYRSLPQPLDPVLATISSRSFETAPLTKGFMLGSALVVTGGFLRWLCYRELGRLFTFSISFRKGHKLVTTGPYSVVRHPSYTAAILCMAGTFIMHGSRGSWLRESGILQVTGVKQIVLSWVGIYAFAIAGLVMRIPEEDAMMRTNFKDQWFAWVKSVKYRLIPGIY
ncbi:hypothetical protein BJ138DRAFT_1172386 [Hygrophoropsis aurantiaca]|uniref:Uncharacterized protein n=1 Tax=Hygrophoropsis aurantiaca TaxID=72124 RepID=A0ACB8AEJ1_9AGAM|nr:hypothetical protein BJ138DRAFT_1172386 [Hygrophoropsis aurantiaca]